MHDDRWEFLGTCTVTAYCPRPKCCSRFAAGNTAAGSRLRRSSRVIAAPPEIPFGTMRSMSRHGKAPIAERSQAIVGRRLDVFFWTHEEAMEWGVRQAKAWRQR